MKLPASFLIFLLAICSCKKDNLPYSFTGKVYDNSGNAVPGVTAELFAYYRGGVLGGGGLNMITSTKTNGSGDFAKGFLIPRVLNSSQFGFHLKIITLFINPL